MTRLSNAFGLLQILLVFFLLNPVARADEPEKTLSYGVSPYLPAHKLEQIHAPIAARLSEVSNYKIILRSRPDFERFRTQVSQQTYDIIFIQPFDYIRVAADNGYQPLACWVAKNAPTPDCKLKAVIVTRNDSDIHKLAELHGKHLSTPNNSAATALLARDSLHQAKLLDTVELHSAGNHDNCMQQVITRKTDACVTAMPPLTLFQQAHGSPLRIIFESEAIPSSLIAIHRRIPSTVRQQIQTELLSWDSADTRQRSLLHKGSWQRMAPVTDSDYTPVRTIWRKSVTSSP